MVKKCGKDEEARLRIDPVLVDKFRRVQGGINEVGIKIVRDFGLRYKYDKNKGSLELIGPDTEILGLAVETLRFWVEDDEFPDTGITCQVGYPNRNNVIWRFHGDYAKKFDHLFADDIAKLKLVTSFNIKAVPSKRNPEYVELHCHFSVYHQVKDEVKRISKEISKIYHDDFFIPQSDFLKARDFARSKVHDEKVLYALKQYPDNKVRVWIFARDQMDVIRAKKEWITHVGIIARENDFIETFRTGNSIKSASFYGHPASEIASEMSGPTQQSIQFTNEEQQHLTSKKTVETSFNLSSSKLNSKSRTNSSHQGTSSHGPRVDNSNFPRPPDFVYPINKEPLEITNMNNADEGDDGPTNPFTANAESLNDGFNNGGILDSSDPTLGEAKWVKEDETNLYPARNLALPVQSRIYVHHQVDDPQLQNSLSTKSGNSTGPEQNGKQVVHPEKNLVEKERYNPTHHSKSVLTSVTDPRQAPAIKRGNKGVRPGERWTKKPTKVNAATRQKRPVLKAKKPPPSIRYNINVNGLDIYMYKQDISRLTNMDALVNVVAPSLKEGDHIATTLFAEAGKKVKDELDIHLRLYGEAKMGENVVTSAGKLPALGIIHVVSPIWNKYTVWEDCASDLHKALYDTLKTAESHKYRRIGIPTIGSEPYFGIPKDLVAEVYVKALIDYSMGMGPMYPVLEIHLVDNDPNMLTYIKDAYESWAATPGVVDMTHHITQVTANSHMSESEKYGSWSDCTDVKAELDPYWSQAPKVGFRTAGLDLYFAEIDNVMNDPNEVSKRSQSAVSLKSMPTHRSENMVTFTGQSYTREGEQMWTFDVLKKLVVQVYTGSVLRLDNSVDAIVCAVDINMKGTLARQIQSLGGRTYKTSLKAARGNKTVVEGDILVCDAGDLGMRKVLHSVIATPIHHINQKNISRLDNINTQVFYVANQHKIKVLAMPLIGTGRLRERIEIEQCSLQLIDNIIELCLSLGNGITLKELHLVNTNHVMTQYLTQALRTRAHTKLRVETEPHEPSRQEVFTKKDAIRRTPERLSARSIRSKGSSNKSLNIKGNRDTPRSTEENRNVSSNDTKKNLNTNKGNNETIQPTQQNGKNTDQVKTDNKKAKLRNVDNSKEDKKFEYMSNSKKNVPYLSKKNLERHDRLINDAWMHLMDDDTEGIKYKTSKERNVIENRDELKRHQQLDPLDRDALIKKAKEFLKERKTEQTKKERKKKHRVIQRSSDFVFQRSKAGSYKKIFEQKQKYAEYTHREEQFKLRKTQSSDDIWKKKIAEEVFEKFKEEREKLSRQKMLAQEEALSQKEKIEKDASVKEAKKYYTRVTADRYKRKANEEDVNEKFERINRIDISEGDGDNKTGLHEIKSKTSRSESYRGVKKTKNRRERHLIDTEREDQYMMDMDFLAQEFEERVREKKLKRSKEAKNTDGGELHNPSSTKSEKNINTGRDKFLAPTSSEKEMPEERQHIQLASTTKSHSKYQNGRVINKHGVDGSKIPVHLDSRRFPVNDISLEKEPSAYSLAETDIEVPTSNRYAHKIPKDANVKQTLRETDKASKHLEYKSKPHTQSIVPALKPGKTFKTYNAYGKAGPADNKPYSNDNHEVGRAQYIQSYNNKPKPENDIPKMTKTIEWKNGMKMNKDTLQLFNEQQRARRAPRPDEVTIRDKLKLHINVIDKEKVDPSRIEREKKKIKRFWEAVDGEELRDEKEMFGDIDNKEKMLVAKVTKERKMSAKSKISRESKRSVVTHNVGSYNVTLEVAS